MHTTYPCGCYFEYEAGIVVTKACGPVHEATIEALLP